MTQNTAQPGQTPAIQTNPHQANIAKMRAMLDNDKVKVQFNNALGNASEPFIASVMEIYSGDSTLVQCDPKLVISEALKAAVLKLPVIRSLGFAWVIPFKKNGVPIPQFQIGYKGYIQLAMRTGQYKTINADKVFEGELQRLNKLSGEIAFEGTKTSEKVEGYFAYFELLNGFQKTLYMTVEQIRTHAKRYSKSFKSTNGKPTIWDEEFDGMALKTVIRILLSHYGYLSIEMVDAMDRDKDFDPEEERDDNLKTSANKKQFNAQDVQYEDVNNGGGNPPTEEAQSEAQPAGPGY